MQGGQSTGLPDLPEKLSELTEGYKLNRYPWYETAAKIYRLESESDALYLTIINPELQNITLYNLENNILKIISLKSGIEIPFKYNRLDSPSVSVLDFDIPGLTGV